MTLSSLDTCPQCSSDISPASTSAGMARRLGHYPAMLERPRDRPTSVQPVEAAAAVDAKNALTATWKTPTAGFPQPRQTSL